MSLNNGQMLPDRVRGMRQMSDLLQAEDLVLDEIERILEGICVRASSVHEELVNEKWLEKRIQEIAGGSVDVEKKSGMLMVDILINRGSLADVGTNAEAVISFLNKWLPAHLAYSITYEKILSAVDRFVGIWQDDEIMILRQVKI